jgi:hypothetical protein
MAKRRVWETLKASYRARLERGGITKSQYESGANLKAARGHATTPENAREYQKDPGRFKEYRQRRKAIIDRVVAKKKEAFEWTLRWNEENSGNFVRNPPQLKKKYGLEVRRATMAQLRAIDAMTVEQLVEHQYEMRQEDDWRFLWYH